MDSFVHLGDAVLPEGVLLERTVADGVERVRLTANRDLTGLASGSFSRLGAHVAVRVDGDPSYLGFAYTQFALPVVAGPALDFDFNPAPNLHSPPAMGMLLARVGDRHVLAGPAGPSARAGDRRRRRRTALGLARRPRRGARRASPRRSASSPVPRRPRCWSDGAPTCARRGRAGRGTANPITSHLSYWTDNGAAYWYRTEPGRTIGPASPRRWRRLRADGVPVHAVELDSWCYQHEVPRPIAEIGYPEEVPPSGLMTWEPRVDAFDPRRRRPRPDRAASPTGSAIRRWSSTPATSRRTRRTSRRGSGGSTHLAAHPVDPTFFRRWFDDARRWGVCAIEQDWMLLYWFGVRALRAAPDRAAAWQRDARRARPASPASI